MTPGMFSYTPAPITKEYIGSPIISETRKTTTDTKKQKIEKISKPFLKGDVYDRTTMPSALKFFAGTVVLAVVFLIFCVMLNFDQTRYYYTFETPDVGKYEVQISYTFGDAPYVSNTVFYLARSPEYDAFAMCSAASLNAALRDRGEVYEYDSLVIEHNKDEVSTYTMDFTVALLAAAVVMYVVDIVIRKLKWADIVSLFKKTSV